MSFSRNESNAMADERKRLLSVQATELDEIEVEIRAPQIKGSSWFASVFMVVNAALGAGLLNFPEAYHQAGGVLVAILIQAVFLIFIIAAIMILAYCSDIKGATTYQDVVLSVCGKNAQRASAMFLTVYCFGTCITFLIIIGDQWEEFFIFVARSFYCEHLPWYMNRATTIVATSVIIILPMSFPKRIDFLKYASFVGVIGIIYVVLLVSIKYFLPHEPPGPIKTKPDQWMDIFYVVPTICFSYQCHVSIIPIYSCMEPRTLKNFSKTISMAIFLCVITYTGTAAFGYFTFGDRITSDILLSYNPDVSVLVAVVLIAVKTYTTYPILLFCGRAALDCLWTDVWRMSPERINSTEPRRRYIMTILWFIATLILAVFIPNIGVVIQLLGAFAAVFIFAFPGMCMLSVAMTEVRENDWSRRLRFIVAFSCCFITLGTFIFGLTLAMSIQSILGGNITADKSRC
ncbi:S38A7-like protein [Mya arenaria]|uniref:S38A7-like protein n=1 Tax=Mya arenaria TaxID=6604 RepID=A0ABY7ENF0_MYAAR|nr:sodium-coupled neutral amino acid transporter 7-like [Mya arenaria]WAR11527.1 S38A7-like protein [Mya arenaria]